MRSRTSLTPKVSTAVALLLAVLVGACRDVPAGPLGVVLPSEMEGSPDVSVELPSFTSFALRHVDSAEASLQEELPGWISRWEASWLMAPLEGRQERTRVYDEAIGPLAASAGSGQVDQVLDGVSSAVEAVRAEADTTLPDVYAYRLEEAVQLVGWARDELASGQASDALRAGLEASDRLRTVNPVTVAEELLARAHAALEAAYPAGSRAVGPVQRRERERIERLLRGARTALDDGEYHRAIRRAYYASRLLGPPAS